MRILQGMTDIASQAGYSAQGLRALGHEVCCAVVTPNTYSAVEPDVVLYPNGLPRRPARWTQRVGFAWKSMRHFDVFHFHFGTSLLPYNIDLDMLRRMDKPVFIEFHGSDIRGGAFWESNPYSHLYHGYDDRALIREHMSKLARKATAVIVHDWELGGYLPDDVNVCYVPLRLDIRAFSPTEPPQNSQLPLIIHLPSNPTVKGSAFVEAALEQLSATHTFEYQAATKLTVHQAHQLIQKSSLVIDQLIIGAYGMLAIETMAYARPVLDYLRDDVLAHYPDDLPVINATVDNLNEILASLFDTPQKLSESGAASRRYIERYHDCNNVAYLLEQAYTSGRGISDAREAYRAVASRR
jgi:hypothetical protein